MLGVLDSSKDFASVSQILHFIAELTVKDPVDAKVFEELLTNGLENDFHALLFA